MLGRDLGLRGAAMTNRKTKQAGWPGPAVRLAVIAAVIAALAGWRTSVAQEKLPDSFRLVLSPGGKAGTEKSCGSYLAATEGHSSGVYNGIEQDGQEYWD